MLRKDNSLTATPSGVSAAGRHKPVVNAAIHIFWAFTALAAGLLIAQDIFAFSVQFVQTSVGAFMVLILGVCGGLIHFTRSAGGRPRRFGPANAVTMGRGVLICLIAGTIGQDWSPIAAWTLVAVSALALLMDGLDGWVARQRGDETAFGALFDQETDAAFIMILAILLVDQGKAGVWIVFAGALRYLFVAAGFFLPKMKGDLPPSIRRKTACVVQVGTLVVCLAPVVPPSASVWLAAGSLAFLVYSFAVDTAILLTSPAPQQPLQRRA